MLTFAFIAFEIRAICLLSVIRVTLKKECAFRIWIVFLPPSLPFYSAPLKKINTAI